MLKTEQNTEEMQHEVMTLEPEDGREHENLSAAFEHGQWWLLCGACGASWVDVYTLTAVQDLKRRHQQQ